VRAAEDPDRLIEVGLDVCACQGYATTTLAEIAAAAGVSEAELIRAFPTTEAIVMVPVDAMLDAVAAAVADVDPETAPVEALKAAHAKVLKDIIDGAGPITRERMQAMGTVVLNSPELQQVMSAHRKAKLGPVLAERLGVHLTDPSVGLAVTTWSAVVAATYSAAPDKLGNFDPRDDAQRPHRMQDRLDRAFRHITGR
jgi:AcrR family transcriptional regulator